MIPSDINNFSPARFNPSPNPTFIPSPTYPPHSFIPSPPPMSPMPSMPLMPPMPPMPHPPPSPHSAYNIPVHKRVISISGSPSPTSFIPSPPSFSPSPPSMSPMPPMPPYSSPSPKYHSHKQLSPENVLKIKLKKLRQKNAEMEKYTRRQQKTFKKIENELKHSIQSSQKKYEKKLTQYAQNINAHHIKHENFGQMMTEAEVNEKVEEITRLQRKLKKAEDEISDMERKWPQDHLQNEMYRYMSSNTLLSHEITAIGDEIATIQTMITAKRDQMRKDKKLSNKCQTFAVKEAIRLNKEYKKEFDSLKQML